MEDVVELQNSDDRDENSGDIYPSGSNTLRGGTLMNLFAMKKTAAQGMMDVALMTANANQLRYLIEFSPQNTTFYVLFMLLVVSLVLQVIVGVFLVIKGRSDFRRRSVLRREKTKNDVHLNHCVSVGIFMITVVNVFIAAFSVNVSSSSSTLQVVKT